MSLFPLYVFILFLRVKSFISFTFSLPQGKNTFQPSYFNIFCLTLLYFWFTFKEGSLSIPLLWKIVTFFFSWVVILEMASCNLFMNVWCWYFSSPTMCGPQNTHFIYHLSWLVLFLPCILGLHECGGICVRVCWGFISSCGFSPPETCLSVCHITLDCILNTAFKKPLLKITWGLWLILLSFREDFWFGRDIVCYYWKSP